MFPFASVEDGIYNAQRVASDHESSILEQRPFGSVHQSNHDPTGSMDVCLRRKQAFSGSNTITTEQPPIHRSSTETKADRHCRDWSLNDLDCTTHTHTLLQNFMFHRSPSSDEALNAAANVTAYPHLPPGSPPFRKSTPEGLPSFGTREAQELRLVPPSRLRRLGTLIRKRIQPLELIENATDSATDAPNIEQPRHQASERPWFEGSADVLKRLSGMVRPVSVTDSSRKSHRSALPRGVKVASAPGDLTVAEDGSHVRGRFGNRVSGHGVGQRAMDLHPLARGQGRSTIEEEVRAINKACDCANLREQDQSSSVAVELRSVFRAEDDNPQFLRGNRDGPTEVPNLAQATQSEQRALRALEERRRQTAELRASLPEIRHAQPAGPSITLDQIHTFQPTHSRNSSSAIYHSARSRNRTCNMRSSASETIGPPRMTEPVVYDTGRRRSEVAQRNRLGTSTRADTVEGDEHYQAFQSARQHRDHNSETEAC